MKKKTLFILLLTLSLLTACRSPEPVPEPTVTVPQTVPTAAIPETLPPETALPETTAPEATVPPEPVIVLTEEEQTMLLKIGMAERGNTGCTQCIALVMRSILNRVEAGHFSSIRSAIFAQDQYLPVSDGSYYTAEPNQACYEALEMVVFGWDESQGAMFYEWCEGESWHSQNLNLLLQHCDTRFYN